MSKTSGKKSHCPFWSEHLLQCQLCEKGLFIPLNGHINEYCKTPEYPLCLQYTMHTESQPVAMDTSLSIITERENRRQFKRMASSCRVTLIRLTENGKLAHHYSVHAQVMDISKGGMRLRSPEQLINDTAISYAFDDTPSSKHYSGFANIKWCHSCKGVAQYEVGLAFKKVQSTESLDMFLRNHPGNY